MKNNKTSVIAETFGMPKGKQNCFTPETNAFACCFGTTYLGNTYGSYAENVVIKRTIQEIQQQT